MRKSFVGTYYTYLCKKIQQEIKRFLRDFADLPKEVKLCILKLAQLYTVGAQSIKESDQRERRSGKTSVTAYGFAIFRVAIRDGL